MDASQYAHGSATEQSVLSWASWNERQLWERACRASSAGSQVLFASSPLLPWIRLHGGGKACKRPLSLETPCKEGVDNGVLGLLKEGEGPERPELLHTHRKESGQGQAQKHSIFSISSFLSLFLPFSLSLLLSFSPTPSFPPSSSSFFFFFGGWYWRFSPGSLH